MKKKRRINCFTCGWPIVDGVCQPKPFRVPRAKLTNTKARRVALPRCGVQTQKERFESWQRAAVSNTFKRTGPQSARALYLANCAARGYTPSKWALNDRECTSDKLEEEADKS